MSAMVQLRHAQFEREKPEWADYARALETGREVMHRLRFAGEDYRPTREFPCLGWLRATDQIGEIVVLACDACLFEISLREKKATW